MENKKQYCILCGAENNLTDKFCHKCGESLDQKDDDLQAYAKEKLKDKVTDDLKDKATDTFLDMLKKFLNSKAYGIILSLSVVAGATSVLAGGASGVSEFANDVPGMFKDGSVYGTNFSNQEALIYTGNVGIYPGYDANGNISVMYIAGNTHFSTYTDLTVTGSDGKTLIDQRIQEDERGRRSFCYVVDDLNATVGIDPGYVSGEVYENSAEIILGTDYGIRKFTQYKLDDILQIEEYYDNGTLKYQYYMSFVHYADVGGVYGDTEVFYDEKGRLVLETSENVKESQRAEYTYYDNGDMFEIRQENGLTSSEVLMDIGGNVLREVIYLDPGEIGYTVENTYYDNGQKKSIVTYGLRESPEDMLCRYEEFYENGNKKLYQDYSSEGNLYVESTYDESGAGQTVQYDYDIDGTRYVGTVYDFYTDEYGNSNITKETVYRADGSVWYVYTYSENGEKTLVE